MGSSRPRSRAWSAEGEPDSLPRYLAARNPASVDQYLSPPRTQVSLWVPPGTGRNVAGPPAHLVGAHRLAPSRIEEHRIGDGPKETPHRHACYWKVCPRFSAPRVLS